MAKPSSARLAAAPAGGVEPAAADAGGEPVSARHAASIPGHSARTAAPQRRGTHERQTATAAPGDGADEGGSRPNRRARRGGGNRALYLIAAVAVLALIAGLSYGPVMRGMKLSELDGFKPAQPGPMDQARRTVALQVADDYIAMVAGDEGRLRNAITADRGPVEAQIHIATRLKSYPALVQIAERRGLHPDLLVATLEAMVAVYDHERPDHAAARPPAAINDWAMDETLRRDASLAAIRVVAKLDRDDAAATFTTIARTPGIDPERSRAALDGLDHVLNSTRNSAKVGLAIGLLNTNAGDQVMGHDGLKATIISRASPGDLDALVDLLKHAHEAVRTLALAALGGPGMSLSDDPGRDGDRQRLGEKIQPKLRRDATPAERTAALHAVKTLRLVGARDEVFAIVGEGDAAGLGAEIDRRFLAMILGDAFISVKSEAALKISGEVVTKLTKGLESPTTRAVSAEALGLLTKPDADRIIALRGALDALAAVGGDEPIAIASLKTLVAKTYGRRDVVDLCGDDAAKWQAFLAKDRPRFDRYAQITAWMADNGKYMRISDGRERLTASRDFLVPAMVDLDLWLNETSFVPPLGLTRDKVRLLNENVKMLKKDVQSSLAGAMH